MANVVATFPGKIGDLFMQYPVARAYARREGMKIDIGIPHDMAGVSELMLEQPSVDSVYYMDEVFQRSWKRDPPPMGIKWESWRRWDYQLEMGFRDQPDDQLTLYTTKCLGFSFDHEDLAPSLFVGERKRENYAVINGTFLSQTGDSPPFWAALGNWLQFMEREFDKIYFVGNVEEMKAVGAAEFPFEMFDDGGNLLLTAKLMNNARIVIGSSSAMAALGGALGLPTIRVHEHIPDFSPHIWDFLLPHQMNYVMQPGDGVEVLKKFMEAWC